MISQLVKLTFGSKSLVILFMLSLLMSCASQTHNERQVESEHLKESNTYQR